MNGLVRAKMVLKTQEISKVLRRIDTLAGLTLDSEDEAANTLRQLLEQFAEHSADLISMRHGI